VKHLLAISIGPVQSFIAAGRRTADLYAGSALLKEVVREIARNMPEDSEFVFPASSDQAAANKLLVMVEEDPSQLAQKLKAAAKQKLLSLWEDNINQLGEYSHKIDNSRAREQLNAFLEFYAAWYPLSAGDYQQTVKEVELLLAGRKALRDFNPPQQDDAGVPKSPLDPAYAAVIDPKEWGEEAKVEGKPLRIRSSESLDAVSLLKRVYGVLNLSSVPSTRVFARRSVDLSFPATEIPESDPPEKRPYFAILMADGDRMGAKISSLKSASEHRRFSGSLSRFAERVEEVVGRYRGYAVYAGGDDVLAFLPIPTALACAKEVRAAFVEEVGEELSISIGLTIVHYRQPLSLSLEDARKTQELAKGKLEEDCRNALAVAYYPRAGRPIRVRMRWDDEQAFQTWSDILKAYREGQLPRGLAYDLGRLAEEWDEERFGANALVREVQRAIKQKKQDISLPLSEIGSKRDLSRLVNQLRIGRFLSPVGGEDLARADS